MRAVIKNKDISLKKKSLAQAFSAGKPKFLALLLCSEISAITTNSSQSPGRVATSHLYASSASGPFNIALASGIQRSQHHSFISIRNAIFLLDDFVDFVVHNF